MSSNTGKFYTNYSFVYPNEGLNSNMKNVSVATSSFQDVPTNKKNLVNLTMNGILRPSEKLHVIEMKFEGDVPEKDYLAESYGTFVLCKDVYNARKIINTRWNKETNTLTITIDLRSYNIRPKRRAQFSFSIQINDFCNPGGRWKRHCNVVSTITNTNSNNTTRQYKISCSCDDKNVPNTILKTALCGDGCLFQNSNGQLVATGDFCVLPKGTWRDSCNVIKKPANTTNGKKKISVACNPTDSCNSKPMRIGNLVNTSIFYNCSWKTNNGVLLRGSCESFIN